MTAGQFDHLRDPDPPEPRAETLDAVRTRARRIQRRGRARVVAVAASTAIAVGIAATVISTAGRDDETIHVTDTIGATTSSSTSVMSPGEAVVLCFPDPFSSTTPPSTVPLVPIEGWPDGAPSLLVLSGNGELWVLDGGEAARWTTASPEGPAAPGYLWARWAGDGTILATRLVDAPHVSLERLTAPGTATVDAELSFTVKPDAPAGFCPINGFLETFAAGPDGVVLLRHTAGPVHHSCPELSPEQAATTSPWRCESPEIVEFAVLHGEASLQGRQVGGRIEVVADASRSPAFVFHDGQTITVVRPGEEPECCFGGQSGTAFSLSPDGDQLAYSPDGHRLVATSVEPTTAAELPIWETDDEITATAYADEWIAVAHGTTISLVSPDGADVRLLSSFGAVSVATLDWAT